MDRYHLALFIHILALVVAAGASAVTKLAATRRARARTVGEMLEWHRVLGSTARLFPACIVAFVLTGGYMLQVARVHAWSSGFIVAGMAGTAMLLASSGFLGFQGKKLQRMLEAMARHDDGQPAPKLAPPPLIAALPAINSAIALAVAFDMVTKPASITVALAVLLIGVIVGALPSLRGARALGVPGNPVAVPAPSSAVQAPSSP